MGLKKFYSMKILNINSNKKSISNVKVGNNVIIYDYVNLYDCKIGDDSKIGTFVEIQKNCVVGNRCKVSSHSFICEGVKIYDGVFIGHNVSFINDLYPRSVNSTGELQGSKDWKVIKTEVHNGVSIGTSSTILCGIKIGEGSIIGAGSVVTKDVPKNVIVAGNPAKIIREIKDE